MLHKYKVAIAGIGGVGGFYGGLLASTYESSSDIMINFVARGNHMLAMRRQGLQLEKDSGNIIATPRCITDKPEELGPLDLIVFCCKTYDLAQLALSFSGNITSETVLLPLLNGVDNADVLRQLFPQAKILYGCTYLVAKKIADATIKQTGDLNQLLLGSPLMGGQELDTISNLFRQTGVNVAVYDDMQLKLWEKYTFVSPLATATAALDSAIGGIRDNEEKKQILRALLEEVVMVARAEGINLPADIIDTNWNKLTQLPAAATSSMHHDFMAHKKTELEVLTGYIVRQGRKWGIATPVYDSLYTSLKERAGS